MAETPPKIEVLGKPRWRGSSLSIRVRFNYENTSLELGFNIPRDHFNSKAELTEELKRLYEENRPETKPVDVPSEIDW